MVDIPEEAVKAAAAAIRRAGDTYTEMAQAALTAALPHLPQGDPSPARELALEEALRNLIHAVCGETGFANAVRQESGHAYPWPALDIAEAEAHRALSSPDHADAGAVAGMEIIGDGATVWVRVDENRDGSQEITVTEVIGLSEVPDGEYLFVRDGSSLPVKDGRRSMDTAPKDGTEILAWRKDCGWFIASFTSCSAFPMSEAELDLLDEETLFKEDWFTQWPQALRLEGSEVPSHWRPLPASPGASE